MFGYFRTLSNRVSPSNPRPTTVRPQQRPQPPDPNRLPSGPPPRPQVTGDGGPRINAPRGAGKFLQNAYASYNAAPEKKPDSALVDYALKEFKRTHKWARAKNANDNRQLEFAVRYLLLSPKKNRYNP